LSAVSLRLAGQVGQATLNRLEADGPTLLADLDQHVSAVRAALAACCSAKPGQRPSAAQARAAVDARVGSAGSSGLGELLSTIARDCPDMPFAADTNSSEPPPPLALLLHYVCGFVEEAVRGDWWPPTDEVEVPDWESIRLAAVCLLISQAEAAEDTHPDLRPRP